MLLPSLLQHKSELSLVQQILQTENPRKDIQNHRYAKI